MVKMELELKIQVVFSDAEVNAWQLSSSRIRKHQCLTFAFFKILLWSYLRPFY